MPRDATARTRLDPDERQEQLLQFGHEFFAEHAFDAVSMDDIAEMAGISKGLLYHYFGGRRGFYLATVRHAVDGVLQAMSQAATDRGDLAAIFGAFVDYAADNAGIYNTVIRGGLGADSEVTAETDRVRRRITDYIFAHTRIKEPTPLERIALSGWLAFAEVATGEWVDQKSVSRGAFVEFALGSLGKLLEQAQSLEVRS